MTYMKGDDTVAPWQWQGTATMNLYGANITSWSVHAGLHLRYVISASICMVAEHRQTQSQLHKMRWQLDCAGWAAAISPALGTEKGGSSSGTMIMWKKHLCCQGLDLGTEIERQGRGTFAKLRLKGATILIAALYLHVHDPADELNPPLLEEVARVFELQGLPWVTYADWNMEPEELIEQGWLHRTGGRVLAQPNLPSTCAAGQGRRTIDYIVASKWASHLLVGRGSEAAPWGPHVPILAEMATRPRAVLVPTVVKPKQLWVKIGEGQSESQEEAQEALTWDEAIAEATGIVADRPKHVFRALCQHLQQHPVGNEMAAFDQVVQVWALGLELWHLSRSEITKSDWKRHTGRGWVKQPKWMHMKDSEVKGTEVDTESRNLLWWATWASLLRQWMQHEEGLPDHGKIRHKILKQAAGFREDMVKGDWAEKLTWHLTSGMIDKISRDTLELLLHAALLQKQR